MCKAFDAAMLVPAVSIRRCHSRIPAVKFLLARARGALYKAVSLPSRAGTVKALADALRTLFTLEREAWGLGMGDGRAAPVNPGPLIDSSKLSREERLQLRNILEQIDKMILKTTTPAAVAEQYARE